MAWAEKQPTAKAVLDSERQLSYQELARATERVAGRLMTLGVEPGDNVCLSGPRSIDMVIATLGVATVGAAYVPLAPEYPTERRAMLVANVDAVLEICIGGVAPVSRTAVSLSELLTDSAPAIDRLPTVGDETRAYVMYTSGSTGQPRGVAVPIGAVRNLVTDQVFVELDPTYVVGHSSNPAFDASTFEIWGALSNGATLRVFDGRNPAAMPAQLRATAGARPTCLFLTTRLLERLALRVPSQLVGLTTVVVGGEQISATPLRSLYEAGFDGHLVNGYGPTETTTFATWSSITPDDLDRTPIPVGCPLTGVSIHLIDETGDLVPSGELGEVYVAGAGVALGYYGHPDLTAERFVELDFPAGVTRAFRTGDIGRICADGQLELHGRRDRQIKLRGHRIEPAEIELALRELGSVLDAVVVVGHDGKERYLRAIVAASGDVPSAATIRTQLERSLPSFAVPTRIDVVDELPLNANGKVDQEALRRLDP